MLSSCAVGEQLKSNFQEASEVYPQIETVNSDIQKTGILLVDAIEKKGLSTLSLSGVAIANMNDPEKLILLGPFQNWWFF